MNNACINECFWRFIWSSLNCANVTSRWDGLPCRCPRRYNISYGTLEVRQIFARPIKLLQFFPPKNTIKGSPEAAFDSFVSSARIILFTHVRAKGITQ